MDELDPEWRGTGEARVGWGCTCIYALRGSEDPEPGGAPRHIRENGDY